MEEPPREGEASAGQEADGREERGIFEPWRDREIVPWEGVDLDAGIAEGYVWGERGGGFIQKVLSFLPSAAASYGHEDFPKRILGAPEGGGMMQGSLDVVSLGCGGEIVLEFSDPLIGDGEGIDFVVFENAFSPSGRGSFAEPAEVSVSVDGKVWKSFPCEPATTRWPYPRCAGVQPVLSSSQNGISPYDVEAAGGDGFDLAWVGMSVARFVRIRDRSAEHSEAARWCSSYNAGFDLDAVAVIWGYRP